MFKLGEYDEGEIKPIVNYLRDAGIKVEQKTSLYAIPDTEEYLEGRLSELRGKIRDIETYERYLVALRTALAKGATPDDLRDKFYYELDPVWAKKSGGLRRYSRIRPISPMKRKRPQRRGWMRLWASSK